MSFAEQLAAGRFPVALEITPPQHRLPHVLRRRAGMLGELACAINVIQRPGRQTSLEACGELLAAGSAPVWHLVARGTTEEAVADALAQATAAGISQVLCIRGDDANADVPGAPSVRDLVAGAAAGLRGALVGTTLNQYVEPERALKLLAPKVAAGATYVQTQPVFEVEQLRPLAEALRARHGHVRMVPMVMPVLSPDVLDRIAGRLGIAVPEAVREGLGGGEEAGWEAFTRVVEGLREEGLADGVAVMTFEMDPPAEFATRLRAALEEAGVRAPRYSKNVTR